MKLTMNIIYGVTFESVKAIIILEEIKKKK